MRKHSQEAQPLLVNSEPPLARNIRAYLPLKFSLHDGGVLILHNEAEEKAVAGQLKEFPRHERKERKGITVGFLVRDQQAWNSAVATLEAGKFVAEKPSKKDYAFDEQIRSVK